MDSSQEQSIEVNGGNMFKNPVGQLSGHQPAERIGPEASYIKRLCYRETTDHQKEGISTKLCPCCKKNSRYRMTIVRGPFSLEQVKELCKIAEVDFGTHLLRHAKSEKWKMEKIPLLGKILKTPDFDSEQGWYEIELFAVCSNYICAEHEHAKFLDRAYYFRKFSIIRLWRLKLLSLMFPYSYDFDGHGK